MRRLALLLLVACRHPMGPDPALPPVSPAYARATAPAPSVATATPPGTAAARPDHAAARSAAAAPQTAAGAAAPAGDRFDEIVRADFFDGLRGDAAAIDRVVKICEDALAKDPGHAEAMVWHGGAMIARAAAAFRSGDRATGMALY